MGEHKGFDNQQFQQELERAMRQHQQHQQWQQWQQWQSRAARRIYFDKALPKTEKAYQLSRIWHHMGQPEPLEDWFALFLDAKERALWMILRA